MSNREYEEYLASQQWAAKRDLVMVRALGRCEIDGCRHKASEIHHLHYRRIFREDLDDLLAICWVHHRQLHCPPSVWKSPAKKAPNITEQLDLFVANDNEPVPANDNTALPVRAKKQG